MTFKDWLNSFEITNEHLNMIFENDLLEGIKMCLNEKIEKEGAMNIPFRFFKEKPDNIFVYDEILVIYTELPVTTTDTSEATEPNETNDPEPQTNQTEKKTDWRVSRLGAKTEITSILESLSHEFLSQFYKWQQETQFSTNEEKDNLITNLMRLSKMTSKIKLDKYKAELQKWLFNKLAQ
jgi:hypothetical protein